jgi:hypothetical protein
VTAGNAKIAAEKECIISATSAILAVRLIPGGNVKSTAVIGIILIVLGIISFAYQGITYTKREKVIDIGPIEATAEKKKTIPLPPILGGLLIVGGIVLLVTGSRKT